MATPFPFVAGAVLEAAELNAITELPSATKTGSYTLVAADAGTRVVMNVASANTVTVDNSLFSAGQIVQISNIGAGVTTVTAGAGVTINSADVLTLAQYQGGSLVFSSASAAIFFPTAKTVADSGLTLISSTTIGSVVSSVTVSGAFSSDYDNYKIMVSPGSSAGGPALLNITFGSTSSGYYWGFAGTTYSTGAALNSAGNNTSSIPVGVHNTNGIGVSCDIIAPNLAKNTIVFAPFVNNATNQNAGIVGAFLNDTTAYTAFTITCASGNITGGTVKVYGYKN